MRPYNNPFEYDQAATIRPNFVRDVFIEDHNYTRFIRSNRNVFIVGERGSGKSMTLFYNSAAVQKLKSEEAGLALDMDFLGVYVPCNTPLTQKPEHELLDPSVAAVVSEHLMVLGIAHAIVKALAFTPDASFLNQDQSIRDEIAYGRHEHKSVHRPAAGAGLAGVVAGSIGHLPAADSGAGAKLDRVSDEPTRPGEDLPDGRPVDPHGARKRSGNTACKWFGADRLLSRHQGLDAWSKRHTSRRRPTPDRIPALSKSDDRKRRRQWPRDAQHMASDQRIAGGWDFDHHHCHTGIVAPEIERPEVVADGDACLRAAIRYAGGAIESKPVGGEWVKWRDQYCLNLMTQETQTFDPYAILCADWGKGHRKRAVYVADVDSRVVRRVGGAGGWSMAAVLKEAERWSSRGPVLATFDAPLGVPESYLAAASRVQEWRSPRTFLELLTRAYSTPRFFDETFVAGDWKVEQPFFKVPLAGAGGLRSYDRAASLRGVKLYRVIDELTAAKTVFAKSGIPGVVGSAACALWQELGFHLEKSRTFRVWPFEGDLAFLLRSAPIVLGEIYPRAAYATALLDAPAALRPRLTVAKTYKNVRCSAIATLQAAKWVRVLGVSIENVVDAQNNEDDFDACITAAALLRCVLEKGQLCLPSLDSARAEGGMLGTATVNLRLPEQKFGRTRASGERATFGATSAIIRNGTRIFPCPIEGCETNFVNTRSGWDGHVGSIRIHPQWHPELTSDEERKRQFEIEFCDFFA